MFCDYFFSIAMKKEPYQMPTLWIAYICQLQIQIFQSGSVWHFWIVQLFESAMSIWGNIKSALTYSNSHTESVSLLLNETDFLESIFTDRYAIQNTSEPIQMQNEFLFPGIWSKLLTKVNLSIYGSFLTAFDTWT